MLKLKGLYTALITPFDEDGDTDLLGLRSNIHYQIQNGVDGLVLLGTTGEAPTLTAQEKRDLIKTAQEAAEGKVPLIVGTGSNSTRQTVENTVMAHQLGADAVLVVTPYYNKPSQEGLYHHFKEVAASVPIPIILYNHPGRCGASISIETIQKLAAMDNIAGVKEVTDSISHLNAVSAAFAPAHTDFNLFCGDDPATLTMLANGWDGVISVASNLVPAQMKQLVDAVLEGKLASAQKIHLQMRPLFDALGSETNPAPIKAALKLCGLPSGKCRQPLWSLQPENLKYLEETLLKMNLPSLQPSGSHG